MKDMDEKAYVSIPQFAKLLGISRIAVFKKVKAGKIKAIRIGRSYAIPGMYVKEILGEELTPVQKKQIDAAVKKTVSEYGEVIRMLGRG